MHLQTPQAMMQETTTRSPGLKFFTSGPTVATVPMNCTQADRTSLWTDAWYCTPLLQQSAVQVTLDDAHERQLCQRVLLQSTSHLMAKEVALAHARHRPQVPSRTYLATRFALGRKSARHSANQDVKSTGRTHSAHVQVRSADGC